MDIIVGMGITQEDSKYEVTYEVINTSINKKILMRRKVIQSQEWEKP